MKPARKNAFTLIELLVVIAIIGVLAAVVLVAINPAKRMAQARDSGRKSDVGQMATAAQAYYTTYQSYPSALGALTVSGDLKQIPSSAAVGSCTPIGAAVTGYAITVGSNTEVLIDSCIEQPTSVGYPVNASWWGWRSATGQAAEYSVAPAP